MDRLDPVLEAVLDTLAPPAPGAWKSSQSGDGSTGEWQTVTGKRGLRAPAPGGKQDTERLQQCPEAEAVSKEEWRVMAAMRLQAGVRGSLAKL